ncbi:serpin B13-like [Sitodiplosis mosellana]|uniref:serpin B13-like n=1 Tax=Sitodiplosis mosellana TaxID=263140 RepID=UPI002443E490|nr:serpin B13-like [Sitodiplosis mosellana]
MDSKLIITCILIVCLSFGVGGTPPRDSRDIHNKEIVGQASNIITSKLLKGSIDSNKNSVFSPFGYATILAILEEGATDDTQNDIKAVLKHPNDRALIRGAYRSVLSHFQGLDPEIAPQFRTWFYIYKNNTADESFKQILQKDYYVTVKDVEPLNFDEEEATQPISKPAEEQDASKTSDEQVTPTNSKDVVEFDSYKMEGGSFDETRIDGQKDASKFDEVVEDRQYVEVPVIKNELQQITKNEEGENAKSEEAISSSNKEAQEKIMHLPFKQYEEMEIMQAEESRSGKAFGGKYGEGASIISGNSIVGEKENFTEKDTYKFEPKMLLFNGLYYHGQWATPFQNLRDENIQNIFYSLDDEKVPIKMMRAHGYFRTGIVPKYNSEAIELPYDNIRYSMLLIMPQGPDGLKKLIDEFNTNSINEISTGLQEELINIAIPKFEVQTNNGAEKVLVKEGLASLFTSKADLSGISKAQKLRVGELQQHVVLTVDELSTAENFMTASNVVRTEAPANERSVIINRPFLFFIRDRIDDVTIIAGKITSLEAFAMDEPQLPNN